MVGDSQPSTLSLAKQCTPALLTAVATSVLYRSSTSEGYALAAGVYALAALSAAILSMDLQRSKSMEHGPKPAREAANSSVQYSYKLSPPECDEHGRVYGGELLKLIDVSAGLVAAKHAGGPCLTISVDRVIFLQEIRVGDVISISSAVNRAWGSSMEIGVKVSKQSRLYPQGAETYCCHAYLTFVAKPTPPPTPSFLLSLSDSLGLTVPPKPLRAKLAEIAPASLLERKRYLLAGRRRAHRIQRPKEYDTLLASFREQLFAIERERRQATSAEEAIGKDALLSTLQNEIIAEAYARNDPDVHVAGGDVVGEIEGYVEPVRVKKVDVEKVLREKTQAGSARALAPKTAVDQLNDPSSQSVDTAVDFADTLVMCLWIVRPQFSNSKGILFGGTLMRWVEEVSTIAARRIHPTASWSSAAIDGLTFLTAVQPGEVCYARAAVLKVYSSSIEVACVVTCEDRNSPKPSIRLVSQSFFTMVAIDPHLGRPLKDALRPVHFPEHSPAERLASGADKRRQDRLLDKQILQRVYS